MTTNLESPQKQTKPLSEKISFWIGIIGTIVTIGLTVWNTITKNQIDAQKATLEMAQAKQDSTLKRIQAELDERTTRIEESKERVERYKWVFDLFPSLTAPDEKKKNFSVNLIRLALTTEEAQTLFTGLQTSKDKNLKSVGETGITAIDNEALYLVNQIDGNDASTRKSAVARLIRAYHSSSQAIGATLDLLGSKKIGTLSASGKINALVFLSNTDSQAWTADQLTEANKVLQSIPRVQGQTQTNKNLGLFKEFIEKAKNLPQRSQ